MQDMQDLQLVLSLPRDRVLELTLAGEVDMATVPPLREAVSRAIASRDYDCLVFDLAGVTFMDSSGLHVLANANQAMMSSGGQTRVVGVARNLRQVFEITGLDRTLAIFSDRSEALAAAG